MKRIQYDLIGGASLSYYPDEDELFLREETRSKDINEICLEWEAADELMVALADARKERAKVKESAA